MAPRNTSSSRLLALGMTVTAAAALLSLACGTGEQQQVVADRCANVTCADPLTCDPGDGQCKCGGEGGLVCAANEVCDAEHRLCAAETCAGVVCTGGQTCDPADGVCKCGGAGGTACKAAEVCRVENRTCVTPDRCYGVSCASGNTCDPADGRCKCGGVACQSFEVCKSGKCVSDPCAGVNCTGGTVCDPADLQCHCGVAAGPICTQGQTCGCQGGGTCASTDMRCLGTSKCATVSCTGGTTCDPDDGKCKCGGPGGPVCGFGQSCDVLSKACLGGDRCSGVTCTGGLTCDPEDGVCKCGGINGQVCIPGDVCAALPTGNKCVTPCDPRQQKCANGQGCYYDVLAERAYCAASGVKIENASCQQFNDCQVSFNCNQQKYQSGYCRRYCNTTDQGGCPLNQQCVQLTGASVPAGVGSCQ